MRINIAASHRFHLLDLARELSNHGHEVRFYSYVPTKRASKFGLKKECSYSLFYLLFPLLALMKLTKGSNWSVRIIHNALDLYLSYFMRPCDVFIGLGTVYKSSFIAAKKRFEAITILEWGSKHNEEQHRILSEIPGLKQQLKYFKERTLDGYNLADYIAIPSAHVRQSFIDRGFSENKLVVNPYGVDLEMFSPTSLKKDDCFDVIMVGGWSYVKGCDLLTDYFRNSNLTFLHVGPIVNLAFPREKNMVHIDAVDQSRLIDYYSRASIFVLPSRAEGLAMVQLQALACGLTIVCSKHTGGSDLKELLHDKRWIIEMDEFTIPELTKCINSALELSKKQVGVRSYAKDMIDLLTWQAYGNRYNKNLECLLYASVKSK
ncbi:glycosyltransferase family 4 protein [Flavihumibacter sp. R14]|nr:glycosyltransferase family 4 protein [Flavihumibacter soli]